MHNINIIHRSFFPTALPCLIGCLSFSLPFLSLPCLFPCPAYFLDLPMPTSFCLCLLPMPISSAFCLLPCPAYFCALPISLPCLFPACFFALPISYYLSLPYLIPCPAYFLDLPMPTSLSYAYFLCLYPCPAYFCALPFSLPCLLPCPTYRSTFFYECMLHGYIASPLY